MDNSKLNDGMNKAKLFQAKAELQMRSSNNTIKNSVYPWSNHDYDYLQYVKNNYTPAKMGISSEPCIDVTINDGIRMPNYIIAAMNDPIPSRNSKAGVDDIDWSNPELMNIRNQYANFKEPYPGFIKEYPEYFPYGIQGENASSYFLHTGFCPTKITSKEECDKKGYTWIPNPVEVPAGASKYFPEAESISSMGGCQKPRYSYVNNSPGDISGLMKGIVPTIGKNVLDLNPVSFISIFMTGSSPNGDFSPLPCREGFSGDRQSKQSAKTKCQFDSLFYLIIIIVPLILLLTQIRI